MSVKAKLRTAGSKVARAALAGVVTVGLLPLPAFANSVQAADLGTQDVTTQATAKDPSNYVIGAAHAAANPAPEILGLSNPAQRSDQEGETTYTFFGDPDVNENPDPYLYNGHNKLTPSWYQPWGSGPMGALGAYKSDATAEADVAAKGIWEQKPDVVLGTGADTYPNTSTTDTEDKTKESWLFYDSANYARAVEKGLNLDANSYHPLAVTYNRVTLYDMVDTMYRLAEAADAVADSNYKAGAYGVGSSIGVGIDDVSVYANSSKTLRYGSAVDIAKDYERYVKGQKGLVLKAIAGGAIAKRTAAIVMSYDSDSKTYTITGAGAQQGTAATNRYLEGVQGAANNLYDSSNVTSRDTDKATATVTAEQLNAADLIIINTNVSESGGTGSNDSITNYLTSDGLIDKTFYCTNWGGGSSFGTTVNSVENAQNVGRMLPCLYPEVLDQSDMIAYYYDTFYHIKSTVLNKFIADHMDGIRNWNNTDSASYTSWEESDVSDYVKEAVEEQLKSGINYLAANASAVAEGAGKDAKYVTVSDYVKEDSSTLGVQVITTKVGDENVDSVEVAYNSTTPTEGNFTLSATTTGDATLSYASSDTSVATVDASGAVTIVGPGTANIVVTAPQTSNYLKASKSVSLTVGSAATISLADDTQTYTGSSITYSGKVTKTDGASGIVSYSYYSDAAGTKSITSSDIVNAGTYYVKASMAAAGTYLSATSDIAKLTVSPASIAAATVTMAKTSAVYTGKTQTAAVTGVKVGSKTLTSSDYTAVAASGKNAGTYSATVTGKGNYTGTAKGTFTITQAKNTATPKKTSVSASFKAKNLKKKAGSVALPKVTTKFGTAKWSVSTRDKKGVLSLSGSKIAVKKKAKKGTYTIKLVAKVAKTANYKAATSKAVTVKVKVK